MELILFLNPIRKRNEAIIDSIHYNMQIETNGKESLDNILNDKRLINLAIKRVLKDWTLEKEIVEIERMQNDIATKKYDKVILRFTSHRDFSQYQELIDSIKYPIFIDANELSLNELKEIKKMHFNGEVYTIYKNNQHEDASLGDLIKALEIIASVSDNIIKYQLSPLEELIYVYDILKMRDYKKANNEKSFSRSRDLNKILFDDKIVCEGYANIMQSVLGMLGINSVLKYYDNTNLKTGHVSNLVYLYDKKYYIEGLFEFDATWEASRQKDYRINSYVWFGNGQVIKNALARQHNLLPSQYNERLPFDNLEKLYKTEAPHMILNPILKRIYEKFGDQETIQSINSLTPEENDKLIKKTLNMVNTEINVESFLKAFYKVRRIEHALNPMAYPLNKKILNRIYLTKMDSGTKFLCRLFGCKSRIKNDVLDLGDNNGYDVGDKIECDAKRLELINLLKLTLAKKNR